MDYITTEKQSNLEKVAVNRSGRSADRRIGSGN
jgi:hypothetical protein